MIEVKSTIEVARPAADVFAFLADAENNPKWQNGMRSCSWKTPPPLGVGSMYEQQAEFLGKTIDSTFEVVDFHAGQSLTIATIKSTFPIRVTRAVTSLDAAHTRIDAFVSGDPTGAFRVAGPLLRQLVQRSVRKDYQRLKSLLETPGQPRQDRSVTSAPE